MGVIWIIFFLFFHSATYSYENETSISYHSYRSCLSLSVNISSNWFVWDLEKNNSKVSHRYVLNEPFHNTSFYKQPSYNSLFYMPKRYLQRRFYNTSSDPFILFPKFLQNYDAHYQESTMRKHFLDSLFRINETNIPREMVVFKNVLANNFGLIVFPDTCEYVRNGGCIYMHHKRIYTLPASRGNVSFTSCKSVVSLTAGAFGTWHFPMELMVSLAGMPDFVLNNPDTLYHVPMKSPFVTNWLSLAGISPHQVVSWPLIQAETLWVPQMAQCGRPTPSQFSWLRSRLAGLPGNGHEANERVLLYVSRSTKSRRVKNAEALQHQLRIWAKAMGYNFILHDDRSLPGLATQINHFSKATIVVAPHGAGLLFTVFSPNNACILEFMPDSEPFPEIYARMAYLRGLNYRLFLTPGSSNQHYMNVSDVDDGLYQCVLHQHALHGNGTFQNTSFFHLSTNVNIPKDTNSSHKRPNLFPVPKITPSTSHPTKVSRSHPPHHTGIPSTHLQGSFMSNMQHPYQPVSQTQMDNVLQSSSSSSQTPFQSSGLQLPKPYRTIVSQPQKQNDAYRSSMLHQQDPFQMDISDPPLQYQQSASMVSKPKPYHPNMPHAQEFHKAKVEQIRESHRAKVTKMQEEYQAKLANNRMAKGSNGGTTNAVVSPLQQRVINRDRFNMNQQPAKKKPTYLSMESNA